MLFYHSFGGAIALLCRHERCESKIAGRAPVLQLDGSAGSETGFSESKKSETLGETESRNPYLRGSVGFGIWGGGLQVRELRD